MSKFSRTATRMPFWLVILLIILPIFAALVALTVGRYHLTIPQVVNALYSRAFHLPLDNTVNSVVFNLRLPRVILAVCIGAGLACSGAAFQGLFGNPLATQDTLGVTAGASVGAVVALLFNQGVFVVQVVALVFGLGTVLLTTLVARRNGKTSIVMLVLSGTIVSALMSAVVSILKYCADPLSKLPEITYWLMGSLSGTTYRGLLLGTPFMIFGIIVMFLLRWKLNILTLSEDEARASGVKVQHIRIVIIIASTMVTASCVSMCGQVGWVGLLVPHCARMIVGSNNRFVIPVSISLGAIFMLIVDTLCRDLMGSEIPISILTALLGAPFFISLLRKTGGGWQ